MQQTQYALVLRFGAVQADIRDPGLHFKLPLVDNVIYFDKRVLDLDLPVQTMLSADRQNLEVDAFTRYRIVDPLRFYQAVDNIALANQRLSSFTNSVDAQRARRAPRATRSCAPSAAAHEPHPGGREPAGRRASASRSSTCA